jgi:hypothetical protein
MFPFLSTVLRPLVVHAYIADFATDTDAEILARHLRKISYVMPCMKLRISDILVKLPEEGQHWIKRLKCEALHSAEMILCYMGRL